MQAARADRLSSAGALLLAASAFAVYVWSSRDIVFAPPDAEQHAVVARSLLRGEGYTENIIPFHPGAYASVRHVPELHGLLRPIVLAALFTIFGVGPFVLHLPNLVYMAATGLVVFWWARRRLGGAFALVACALTVLSPVLLYFALLATDDVGFAFFFVLTLALLDRALAGGEDRDYALAGLASGVALLEKPSGLFIGVVFVVLVLRFGGGGLGNRARRLALLLFPFGAALGVYAVRNWLAYGSPQFRMGVLEWMYKVEGEEGWDRLLGGVPSLAGMLRATGWPRAVDAVRREFAKCLEMLLPIGTVAAGKVPAFFVDVFLPTLGLACILVQWRRERALGWLVLTSVGAAALFVCVMWHFQSRYFAFVLPLSTVPAAGLLASAFHRAPGRLGRAASALAAVGLVVTAGALFAGAQDGIRNFPDLCACRPALAWLARNTGPAERVLSFDPWSVAWIADRDGIIIPTGGAEPIAIVARRYDAHWLLAFPTSLRPVTSPFVMGLDGEAAGLRLTRRFDEGGCRILRLDWTPDGRTP
jgi:hypothetical protein